MRSGAAAVAATLVLATVLGALVYGRRSTGRTLGDWALGGRRFGSWLFWFVNAGEIYTTFAVLGIAGWAWAYGAPAYIAFTSVSLASALGYWLLPRVWSVGRTHGLVTQADFFAHHYRSPALAVVVALAGIAALVVYVQIQITALALILRLTVAPGLGAGTAAVLAALGMLAFVALAGLRSAAFAAGVKDVGMLVLVLGLSVTAAAKVGATSMLDVYRRVQDLHPGIGVLPGLRPDAGLGVAWLLTAALNVALGTWIFPHLFQLAYAARDEDAIRRNCVWQPVYSLSYFFVLLLGFAALLSGVTVPDGNPNAALLLFVAERYPPWAVGATAGIGCLLALVPGSMLLLTAGSIAGRNVALPLRPGLSDRAVLTVSRLAMCGFAACAVGLSLTQNRSLVEVGLSAYAAIGLLAPGVFLALLWPRASAAGVAAGLVTGYAALLLPAADRLVGARLPGWDRGLVAMALDAGVAVAVSALWPRRVAAAPSRATVVSR